tara:strand:+ start:131 stop:1357 length:1227 start_codon:yes stop_codon:yes gene_type:complete
MAENIEAKLIDSEEPSIQEKEQAVLENAGIDINKDDGVFKVDLSKPPVEKEEPTDAVQEQSADEVPVRDEPEASQEVAEEVRSTEEPSQESEEEEEEVVLQEITEEEITEEAEAAPTAEEVIEAVEESQETGIELPENIQKVVDFINDTGGTLEDYVSLNKDYSNVDDQNLLKEYYQKTKPHLSIDEIDFLIEDKFSFDEEIDEERDIKRKKLAFKEELAGAKNHLNSLKTKYYEEIKGGSRLTQDQQKAVDFFNRYNKETEEVTKVAEKQKSLFQQKTNQVFSDQFKGFEYNVGEKKYRFNVKNTDEIKTTQSDINNFVKKFLNENNEMSDAKGYHKSLFTAMNADTIANHFYQQGKTDALRESMGKAKNIKMDPRGVHNQPGNNSGIKARVVGESTSSLKMKLKNY